MNKLSTTIISNVDPLSESFTFQKIGSLNTLPQARWRSLWGNFSIMHFHAKTQKTKSFGDEANSEHDELETLVDNECRWTPVLKNLEATYIAFARNENTKLETPHTEGTVSRAILQLARSYYEEIWQSLTIDEHLALFHLAKDRFIHFEHPGLEPLIRKGLLRFDPDLRLLNSSFREFVLIIGERDKFETQNPDKRIVSGKK